MSEEVSEPRTLDHVKQEHVNLAHQLGLLEYQINVYTKDKEQIMQAMHKLNLEAAELQKPKEEEPKKVEAEVV